MKGGWWVCRNFWRFIMKFFSLCITSITEVREPIVPISKAKTFHWNAKFFNQDKFCTIQKPINPSFFFWNTHFVSNFQVIWQLWRSFGNSKLQHRDRQLNDQQTIEAKMHKGRIGQDMLFCLWHKEIENITLRKDFICIQKNI